MRVVQRRLKRTEVLVWLSIAGILVGSASVVAADWLANRTEIAVDAASASNPRSRMLVDAESMPDSTEPSIASTTAGPVAAPIAVESQAADPTTTLAPTTAAPATAAPTSPAPTQPPTTAAPTTPAPTAPPTTAAPTTPAPTTAAPTTQPPTTAAPTTAAPTTQPPTTAAPTTAAPTTAAPTTPAPTAPPTTEPPTTEPPTTQPPATDPPVIEDEHDNDDGFSAARITSFTLINARSDSDLFNLSDGATISLDEVGSNLSIRANVSQSVGSVVWSINGRRFKVENTNPYALGGNSGGNYGTVKIKPGTYTFTAQMFSKQRGRGEAGHAVSMTVTFT